MAKPVFNNGENGKATAELNKKILTVVLMASTIGSTIGVGVFLYSLLGFRHWIFDNVVAYVCYGVCAFVACYLGDKGVKIYGISFFTELLAACTGRFETFGILRITSAFFKFCMLIGCFMFSYFTSKDGANILATIAQRAEIKANYNPSQFATNTSDLRESELKSYKNDIAAIEQKREQKIKTSISEYQYKQYKKGTILDVARPTIQQIEKDFAKELTGAKTALQNAQSTFDKKHTAAQGLETQNLEQNAQDSRTMYNTVSSVLNIVGVYPMWAVLVLIGMICIDKVNSAVSELPKPQPTPQGGSDTGNRRHNAPSRKDEDEEFERSF